MVALVEAVDEYVQNGVSLPPVRLAQDRAANDRRGTPRLEAHRSADEVSLDAPRSRDTDDGTRGEQLEALGPSSRDPHSIAVAREMIEEASTDLEVLPARWRIALTRSTPDTVELLGATESRVFQLRTAARHLLEGRRPIAA